MNQREQNREVLRVAGMLAVIDALRLKLGARLTAFVDDLTGYKLGRDMPPREKK